MITTTIKQMGARFIFITSAKDEVTSSNAPVELFCPHPHPGQPWSQKENVCDKKGQGTGKIVIIVFIRAGQDKY